MQATYKVKSENRLKLKQRVWYDQIEGERAGEEVGERRLKGENSSAVIRHTRVSVRNYQLSTAQPLDTRYLPSTNSRQPR